MSEVPKLEAEVSIEIENNNAKPDEKTPAAEKKEDEQEETQVYETLVSSRLAEVQDRAVENEITERVRVTMPMMPSMMSEVGKEMSTSLQKELPKTLIYECGGGAGAEEAADEMFRRDTSSKTMQELSRAGYQTLESSLLF